MSNEGSPCRNLRFWFYLMSTFQELDEEESSLLRNCGKHPYLRRSETEPRALGKQIYFAPSLLRVFSLGLLSRRASV